MLTDTQQRYIEYLRFSLTDLCNIRCHYCMPEVGAQKESHENRLTFDEIERMIRILIHLGVKRVRLTGGEPLIRPDIIQLVTQLSRIIGLEELCLTTNGLKLPELAFDLREAGLDHINVHLDTLSEDKFRWITKGGDIQSVFDGLKKSREVGFDPIKINCVLQKGINDEEIGALLQYCAGEGYLLRLIEMMPLGPGRDLMPKHYISFQDILEKLKENFTLIPSTSRFGKGPARYYWIPELETHLGCITPISQPFCDSCNRIRVSSDGRFQDCLAYTGQFSFLDSLRQGVADGVIIKKVKELLLFKKEGHEGFLQADAIRTSCMSSIGG